MSQLSNWRGSRLPLILRCEPRGLYELRLVFSMRLHDHWSVDSRARSGSAGVVHLQLLCARQASIGHWIDDGSNDEEPQRQLQQCKPMRPPGFMSVVADQCIGWRRPMNRKSWRKRPLSRTLTLGRLLGFPKSGTLESLSVSQSDQQELRDALTIY